MTIKSTSIYCPICKAPILVQSYYLHSIFGDTLTYRIACLVSHSRHYHTTEYNIGLLQKIRNNNEKYEIFKSEVNNKVKIKLINAFLNDKRLSEKTKLEYIHAFSNLKHNDNEVIRLIEAITNPDQTKIDEYLSFSPTSG